VTHVQSLLAQASDGQLLDVAKHASALLRERSPRLFSELVKAVNGSHAGKIKPQGVSSESDLTLPPAFLVAKRKEVWSKMCNDDVIVTYYTRIVKQHQTANPKAAVDTEILAENSGVDVAKYHRGKQLREKYLADSGLYRLPNGQLAPLQGFKDPDGVDSLCEEQQESKLDKPDLSGLTAEQMSGLFAQFLILANTVNKESTPATSSGDGSGTSGTKIPPPPQGGGHHSPK